MPASGGSRGASPCQQETVAARACSLAAISSRANNQFTNLHGYVIMKSSGVCGLISASLFPAAKALVPVRAEG